MKTLLFLTIPLFLAGCLSPSTSPKPTYYLLQPATDFARSEKEFTLPFLIIGPIDLSPYLDQPKIALRVGENQIEYQDYDRWAEPLDVNISSVLAENLRDYYQTPNVGQGAPKILLRRERPRVLILINRMDVSEKGVATLSTQWALSLKGKDIPSIVHQSDYQTEVQGTDMLSRVNALNQLLTEFSLALAKTIEEEM